MKREINMNKMHAPIRIQLHYSHIIIALSLSTIRSGRNHSKFVGARYYNVDHRHLKLPRRHNNNNNNGMNISFLFFLLNGFAKAATNAIVLQTFYPKTATMLQN